MTLINNSGLSIFWPMIDMYKGPTIVTRFQNGNNGNVDGNQTKDSCGESY